MEITFKTFITRQNIRIEIHDSITCHSFTPEVIHNLVTVYPLLRVGWSEKWVVPANRLTLWKYFFEDAQKEQLALLEVENHYLELLGAQPGILPELIDRFLLLFLESPPRMQVQEYALSLKVSQQYLNKSLRVYFGCSANALLVFRILLVIKNNLIYTDLPIKAIAFDLGFSELSNFHNFLKKHTRLTPYQFREDFVPA